MSRKAGIAIAVLLTVVFTFLIVVAANRKNAANARTVGVVKSTTFIPAGAKIDEKMITRVEMPEQLAKGYVHYPGNIVGKSANVSLVAGQYIPESAVDSGESRKTGYVEVFVPVDVPSSACVLPGETVDVYAVNKQEGNSVLVSKGIRVLHTVGPDGKQVDPTKGKPVVEMGGGQYAAVGLEVPDNLAAQVTGLAAAKSLYLVKSGE